MKKMMIMLILVFLVVLGGVVCGDWKPSNTYHWIFTEGENDDLYVRFNPESNDWQYRVTTGNLPNGNWRTREDFNDPTFIPGTIVTRGTISNNNLNQDTFDFLSGLYSSTQEEDLMVDKYKKGTLFMQSSLSDGANNIQYQSKDGNYWGDTLTEERYPRDGFFEQEGYDNNAEFKNMIKTAEEIRDLGKEGESILRTNAGLSGSSETTTEPNNLADIIRAQIVGIDSTVAPDADPSKVPSGWTVTDTTKPHISTRKIDGITYRYNTKTKQVSIKTDNGWKTIEELQEIVEDQNSDTAGQQEALANIQKILATNVKGMDKGNIKIETNKETGRLYLITEEASATTPPATAEESNSFVRYGIDMPESLFNLIYDKDRIDTTTGYEELNDGWTRTQDGYKDNQGNTWTTKDGITWTITNKEGIKTTEMQFTGNGDTVTKKYADDGKTVKSVKYNTKEINLALGQKLKVGKDGTLTFKGQEAEIDRDGVITTDDGTSYATISNTNFIKVTKDDQVIILEGDKQIMPSMTEEEFDTQLANFKGVEQLALAHKINKHEKLGLDLSKCTQGTCTSEDEKTTLSFGEDGKPIVNEKGKTEGDFKETTFTTSGQVESINKKEKGETAYLEYEYDAEGKVTHTYLGTAPGAENRLGELLNPPDEELALFRDLQVYYINIGGEKLYFDGSRYYKVTEDGEIERVKEEDLKEDAKALRNSLGLIDKKPPSSTQRVMQGFVSALETASRGGIGKVFSLFMEDEKLAEWRENVDDFLCKTIIGGGIDCWTSKICSMWVDVDSQEGTAYIESPPGLLNLAAHIEAEKTYSLDDILYKISFVVKNPETAEDADIGAKIVLYGQGTITLFEGELKPGETFSRAGTSVFVQYMQQDYSEACIEFEREIRTASGKSVKKICNRIVEVG